MSQVKETHYILYLVEGALLSIQQAVAGNWNVYVILILKINNLT